MWNELATDAGLIADDIIVYDRRERSGHVYVRFSCSSVGVPAGELDARPDTEDGSGGPSCSSRHRPLRLTEDVMNMPSSDLSDILQLSIRGAIAGFSKGAFEKTPNLIELTIYGTCSVCVKNGWFEGLNLLKKLYLNNNEISNIEDFAFQHLPKLEFLSLTYNKIVSIQRGWFHGAVMLTTLEIEYNPLMNIGNIVTQESPFVHLTKLRTLELAYGSLTNNDIVALDGLASKVDLAGNPLRCTCALSWLELQDQKDYVTDFNRLTCNHPPSLRNTLVSNLTLSNITCLKPVVKIGVSSLPQNRAGIHKPVNGHLSIEDAVYLTCDVYWEVPPLVTLVLANRTAFSHTTRLGEGDRIETVSEPANLTIVITQSLKTGGWQSPSEASGNAPSSNYVAKTTLSLAVSRFMLLSLGRFSCTASFREANSTETVVYSLSDHSTATASVVSPTQKYAVTMVVDKTNPSLYKHSVLHGFRYWVHVVGAVVSAFVILGLATRLLVKLKKRRLQELNQRTPAAPNARGNAGDDGDYTIQPYAVADYTNAVENEYEVIPDTRRRQEAKHETFYHMENQKANTDEKPPDSRYLPMDKHSARNDHGTACLHEGDNHESGSEGTQTETNNLFTRQSDKFASCLPDNLATFPPAEVQASCNDPALCAKPSLIEVRDRRETLQSVFVKISCRTEDAHVVGLRALPVAEVDRCKHRHRRLRLTHQIINMSLFDLKGIEKLGTLKLNGDIAEISEDTFNLTSNLTSLYITRTCIACVKRTWFVGLDRLTDLDLSQNGISNIEDGAFEHVPKLEMLSLNYNNIKSVRAAWFRGADKLRWLEIENNPLVKVGNRESPFAHLPKLAWLFLSHGLLTDIHVNHFQNLTALKEVELSDNAIADLPIGAFRGTDDVADYSRLTCGYPPSLRDTLVSNLTLSNVTCPKPAVKLGVSYTKEAASVREAISGLVLKEPRRKQTIRSSDNLTFGKAFYPLLTASPATINAQARCNGPALCLNPSNIKVRDRRFEDGLKEISVNAFCSNLIVKRGLGTRFQMEEPRRASTVGCDTQVMVTFIAGAGLQEYSQIKALALRGDVARFSVGAFEKIPNLVRLSVWRSCIVCVEKSWFVAGLDQLKNLDLSHNEISNIEDGAFEQLPKLETLSLTYNRIGSVQAAWFRGAHMLKELEIKMNPLYKIGNIMVPESPFAQMQNLTKLDLSYGSLNTLVSNIGMDNAICPNPVARLGAFSRQTNTVKHTGIYNNTVELSSEHDVIYISCDLYWEVPPLVTFTLADKPVFSHAMRLGEEDRTETVSEPANLTITLTQSMRTGGWQCPQEYCTDARSSNYVAKTTLSLAVSRFVLLSFGHSSCAASSVAGNSTAMIFFSSSNNDRGTTHTTSWRSTFASSQFVTPTIASSPQRNAGTMVSEKTDPSLSKEDSAPRGFRYWVPMGAGIAATSLLGLGLITALFFQRRNAKRIQLSNRRNNAIQNATVCATMSYSLHYATQPYAAANTEIDETDVNLYDNEQCIDRDVSGRSLETHGTICEQEEAECSISTCCMSETEAESFYHVEDRAEEDGSMCSDSTPMDGQDAPNNDIETESNSVNSSYTQTGQDPETEDMPFYQMHNNTDIERSVPSDN
ncbi:hypothetical protein Bbelb_102370 [Branchiostoma belcheri]|nr:hypothetical protein Bbelb_102370 [Branchiostoma belcheri]